MLWLFWRNSKIKAGGMIAIQLHLHLVPQANNTVDVTTPFIVPYAKKGG